MALVSYSDSESDGESGPALPPPPPPSKPPSSSSSLSLPPPKSSKPTSGSSLALPLPKQAPPPPPPPPSSSSSSSSPTPSTSSSSLALPLPKRRKLVSDASDTGGPRKIVVDLPKSSTDDGGEVGESSASGKSAFGKGGSGKGLLSFLPAPKRTGEAAAAVAKAADKNESTATHKTSTAGENGVEGPKRRRVLGGAGAGVMQYAGTEMQPSVEEAEDESYGNANPIASSTTTTAPTATSNAAMAPPPVAGMKPRTIQPFFRKTGKAKAKPAGTAASGSSFTPAVKETKKVSLFSIGSKEDTSSRVLSESSKSREYEPIMLTEEGDDDDEAEAGMVSDQYAQGVAVPTGPQPDTLESIGQEIGLDEASMRMLQGRRGRNMPVKITEFNVEREYNANEAKRLAGELAPEVNPLRSITPGKHQLTSLLNAAQSQKTALEEHFAQGRKNKKEAGSKYGW